MASRRMETEDMETSGWAIDEVVYLVVTARHPVTANAGEGRHCSTVVSTVEAEETDSEAAAAAPW